MTAILAIKDSAGNIYMGSDTQVTCGQKQDHIVDGKVFAKDEMVIGCAGELKYINYIQNRWFIPERSREYDCDMEYLCCSVVGSLEESLSSLGEWKPKGIILVAYRGELYSIGYDLSVMHIHDEVYAEGNGHEVAKGYAQGLLDGLGDDVDSDDYEGILHAAIRYTGDHVEGVGGIGPVLCMKTEIVEDTND